MNNDFDEYKKNDEENAKDYNSSGGDNRNMFTSGGDDLNQINKPADNNEPIEMKKDDENSYKNPWQDSNQNQSTQQNVYGSQNGNSYFNNNQNNVNYTQDNRQNYYGAGNNSSSSNEGAKRYTYTPINNFGTTNFEHKKKNKGLSVFAVMVGVLLVVSLIALSVSSLVISLRNSNIKLPEIVEDIIGDNDKDKKDNTEEKKNDENLPTLDIKDNAVVAKSVDNGVLTGPQVAEKVRPSVVGILSTTKVGSKGAGSGIIMSEDGYIITNAHVIEGATDIRVVDYYKNEYTAKVIGSDTQTDLAVIKVDAKGLKPAEFGDSDKIVVGEFAMAIGNPMGMELFGSVTQGCISGDNREISLNGRIVSLIQTDASINPGNSGGPLVNQMGQVIGINTIKISSSNYEGLGFAIPINYAKPIIDELIKNGYITGRPLIGINGETVNSISRYYNIPLGVYVHSVDTNSDAYAKGIRSGDIITAVNGKEIKSIEELNTEKDKYKAGDYITLTIFRGGRTYEVTIKLEEYVPTTEQNP